MIDGGKQYLNTKCWNRNSVWKAITHSCLPMTKWRLIFLSLEQEHEQLRLFLLAADIINVSLELFVSSFLYTFFTSSQES
jgi:hypothetical protein